MLYLLLEYSNFQFSVSNHKFQLDIAEFDNFINTGTHIWQYSDNSYYICTKGLFMFIKCKMNVCQPVENKVFQLHCLCILW